jgi:ribA/ribD-fused uncharacterized protein
MAATDILEFQGPYRFLSNFEGPEVKFGSLWFPKVEHAYQAAKSLDIEVRKTFINPLLSPGLAKKMGKPPKMVLRSDWEKVRLPVMEILVRQKFLYQECLSKLLATENAKLVEGNYWHDNFWGDCYCYDCKKIVGANHPGLILMGIRDEMQNFKMVFNQKEALLCSAKTTPAA